MSTHDTPGSGKTTVDPGQIHKFAALLDDVTKQANSHFQNKVDGFAHAHSSVFGDYGAESTRAEHKHREMVSDAREFAKTMHERIADVAAGAHEVANRYHDLADLNATQNSDISAAMAAGARKRA